MSKIQDLKGTHNSKWLQYQQLRLFLMSKIQDLKGTHNELVKLVALGQVVSDVKDTRFERNSQHRMINKVIFFCCFWCQRYKIWKELTTSSHWSSVVVLLFLMSKIQDLKGTHNVWVLHFQDFPVVSDVKDTRFERNSQLDIPFANIATGCFWCQRYKIWKELTTTQKNSHKFILLFLMSKIQDLKGTHNALCTSLVLKKVVSDVKDTRFERNSQRIGWNTERR